VQIVEEQKENGEKVEDNAFKAEEKKEEISKINCYIKAKNSLE